MPRGRPRGRRAAATVESILPADPESEEEVEEAAHDPTAEALDLEVLEDLNRSRFQNFCDLSLSEGTKRQYGYKLETLKTFLRTQFPNQIQNDNIVLPLGENIITAFFGYIAFKRGRNGEDINANIDNENGPQTLSHQYISTYRSAIVSEYTRQNCRFQLIASPLLSAPPFL